jgi:hypothetical protein
MSPLGAFHGAHQVLQERFTFYGLKSYQSYSREHQGSKTTFSKGANGRNILGRIVRVDWSGLTCRQLGEILRVLCATSSAIASMLEDDIRRKA